MSHILQDCSTPIGCAFQIQGANENVWVYELERRTLTRITAEWDNALPLWAPNSRELAFTSTRSGAFNLFRKSADGVGDATRFAASEYTQLPESWSPDGSVLVFSESTGAPTGRDIWVLSVGSSGTPKLFLQTQANEWWAAFSPDSRWIAYVSDESGQDEIYLRRYPGALEKRQVSAEGGTMPVWNPNGRELFYRNGGKMMVVSVQTEGELVELLLGDPTILYERPFAPSFFPTYSVTPDGQRFIDLEVTDTEPAPTELVLVQNWFQELERLVPTEN
ncbi:MAG: hypothetical protein BMS9Abin37_0315 [Acidobacteriota bacterium]|nr:MAG: hypothetical protein BMS9Abin37_0315 [Acidobacteriota bacterium]